MKKMLSLALAFVLVLSLAACGGSAGGDVKEPSSVSTGDTEPQTNGDDNAAEPSAPADATIEETVLVDESGVKITAKSLGTESLFGAELKLLIENNSGKDLTIQCRNASVNGYMVETMMSADVVNGKKANDSITFMSSDLEACGITSIADMEFSFHIFTTADWEAYLDTALIQLKTSIADTYTYTFDDSGEVAYDANGVKIVIKGLSDSSIFGPGVMVYIENNREKGVTVQTRDVSINGFMASAMFSSDVMPGKKAVDTITFLSSELEENEITSIQDVELSFHIFDTDSMDGIVDTDVVHMTF